jgi:hypothetical protein
MDVIKIIASCILILLVLVIVLIAPKAKEILIEILHGAPALIKTMRQARYWRKNIVLYLDNYAEKHNKAPLTEKEYFDILDKYCAIVDGYDFKLQFREGRGLESNTLNANAGLCKVPIVVTPKWASQLVFESSAETQNAFMMTLGHELTHKDRDIITLFHPFHFKLYSWISEIHADFGAAQKFGGIYDRDSLLCSIDYKAKYAEYNMDGLEHPSWGTRRRYALHYNFNYELLEEIARNVSLNPSGMIMKLRLKYILWRYKQINLKQEPYSIGNKDCYD